MAGGIDLYAGRQPIAGINLFKADKNPLNQLDMGIEDVIGAQGDSTGTQVNAFIKSLVDAILGLGDDLTEGAEELWTGTWDYVNKFFGDMENFLAVPGGYLGTGGFDLDAAITDFITANLHPQNLLGPMDPNTGLLFGVNIPGLDATKIVSGLFPQSQISGLEDDLEGLWGAIASGDPAAIIEAITGIVDGSTDDLENWSENLTTMLGLPPLNDSAFDGLAAVEQFILDMINPANLLGPMDPNTGLLMPVNIPGLDATKIISGLFPQSQVANLEDDLNDLWNSLSSGDVQGVIDALMNAMGFTDATPETPWTTDDLYNAFVASILQQGSALNAQNLYNQVRAQLLGAVPYSHVGEANPNLLTIPGFDTPDSVLTAPGWTWDNTDGHVTPGCAKATASGAPLKLVGNVIQATPTTPMTIGAWVKYEGLTATAGQNAIRISVAEYLGTALIRTTMVVGIASPTGTSAWTQISANYTVGSGVDNIVVQLEVTGAATAGTVKFDDASAIKTGLMSGNWMKALNGTVIGDMQSQVDQIWQAMKGGSATGNPLTSIKTNLLAIPGPNIATTILAAIIPGLDATKITTGLFDLLRIPGLPTSQITTGIFNALQIPGLDATKIVSGVMNIIQIPTNQLGITNINDLQHLTDNITEYIFGGIPVGTSIDDARNALDTHWRVTTDSAEAIEQLASAATGGSTGGMSLHIDFADFGDSAQMPNPADPLNPGAGGWVTTYSGPGASTLGIKSGTVSTYLNGGGSKTAVTHHPTPTLTNYQRLGVVLSLPPTGTGWNWLCLRCNAANTNYVYVLLKEIGFLSYSIELGYVLANAKTIWVPAKTIGANTVAKFFAGTGSSERNYQVYAGTSLLMNYTEVGTASMCDANHRFWGARIDTNGSDRPATVNTADIADSAPPSVAGSTIRVYRANTAAAALTNGAKFPTGVFDTISFASGDYTPMQANSGIKITEPGPYLVDLSVWKNSATTEGVSLALRIYVNNDIRSVGGSISPVVEPTLTGGGPTYTPAWRGMTHHDVVYCNKDDVIYPGYAGTAFSTIGDSSGLNTYMTVTRLR